MLPVRRFALALALFVTGLVLIPLACSSQSPNPPPANPDAGPPPPNYDGYSPPQDMGVIDTFVPDLGFDQGVDAPTADASEAGEGGEGGLGDACSGSTDPSGCGGLSCPPCGNGLLCDKGSDCVNLVCGVKNACAVPPCMCQAPTCSDGVKNEGETDVDCGGTNCPKCGVGKGCTGPTDCNSGVCNTNVCGCPPNMVPVPVATGGDYCIDYVEIDKKTYKAFVDANPIPMNQPAYCSWNANYVPHGDWPPTLTNTGYNGGEPVHYVNWCDAFAYCSWAGKRLCGAITGGPVPQANPDGGASPPNDANEDEWYNACSAEGVNAYPYDIATYQGTSCNGVNNPPANGGGKVWPQLDFGDNLLMNNIPCIGGVSGIYNMSGDVSEWEDSCTGQTGPADTCYARGGSFTSNSTDLRCDSLTINVPRQPASDAQIANIGFRCCL